MDGPDPKRLVLIFSKQADTSGIRFGTGYFVTPTLVLTACHVIPADANEVTVRLESTGEYRKAKTKDGKVAVVWRDAQLDAALFEVATAIGDADPLAWLEAMPAKDEEWRSTAYPAAAQEAVANTVEFKTVGLKGTLYSQGGGGQGGGRELDLSVEAGAEPKGWKGISGAPVFVANRLAGIVKQVPDDFKGGRLRGVRATSLLANAAFREAIEPQWLEWPADERWVLVIQSEKPKVDLASIAPGVLNNFNDKYLPSTDGQPFSAKPIIVPIEEALASPGRWLQFVKALCLAPVVIADVTQFQPGVMLALGVRAVVRRAVTITSTAERYDETHLWNLPFNIQESKLLCHGLRVPAANPKHPINLISQAIRDGLVESRHHAHYLDLPAYDAVRCTVSETVTGLYSTQNSVLVLCPFQPSYADNWDALSDSIYRRYAPKQAIRMLDIGSPRLVGQALYECIRWTPICIVDWSGWRPNVFFELGVRLACSSTGPLSLIDSNEPGAPETLQAKRLLALFQPACYDRQNPDEALTPAFQSHEQAISGRDGETPLTSLAHDATHRLATASFVWETDESTVEPHVLLRASIDDNIGKDPQKSGMPAVLFAANSEFAERIQGSMRERWIAAWYYLKYRYGEELKSDGSLMKEIERVGENLFPAIPADTKDTNLRRLKDEVVEYIPRLRIPATNGTPTNISDAIRELKTKAKNRRDLQLYDAAAQILDQAIGLAEPNLSNPEMRRLMAEELADCHGLLGGVQRRWALSSTSAPDRAAHLRESIKAYDEAWKFESGDYGLVNSYGMINRLVSRLLLKPESLSEQSQSEFGEGVTPIVMRQELSDARQRIEAQLKLPRRDDYWAACDLALVNILLGEEEPARAYAVFIEKSPPDYAFKSTLDILVPLANLAWPLSGVMARTVSVIEEAAKKVSVH